MNSTGRCFVPVINSSLLRMLAGALLACSVLTVPALAQKVRLATTVGDVVIQLDPQKAPVTVQNFVKYTKAGHYDGTIFHRVIENFMVQGGGLTADFREKPTRAPIALESKNGLSNIRGSVAMARTASPDSATAQFFINVNDNTFLDQPNASDGAGYAVFGRVVQGMEVVDQIQSAPTDKSGVRQNSPKQAIVIKKVTIEN